MLKILSLWFADGKWGRCSMWFAWFIASFLRPFGWVLPVASHARQGDQGVHIANVNEVVTFKAAFATRMLLRSLPSRTGGTELAAPSQNGAALFGVSQ